MSEMNFEQLREWIGKTESANDTVTAWPVAALAATLNRTEAEPVRGDVLPACWHWSASGWTRCAPLPCC